METTLARPADDQDSADECAQFQRRRINRQKALLAGQLGGGDHGPAYDAVLELAARSAIKHQADCEMWRATERALREAEWSRDAANVAALRKIAEDARLKEEKARRQAERTKARLEELARRDVHRQAVRPARVFRPRVQRNARSQRRVGVARPTAKTTSTGDPDPAEPDSNQRASRSGGSL